MKFSTFALDKLRFALKVVALLAPVTAALSGCGGGGVSTSTFILTTDWSNSGSPTGGKSEQVQLYDPNGSLVQTLVLDSTSNASQPFTSLANGNYHLSVTLYSQTGASGTAIGTADYGFNPSSTHSITLAVGATETGLVVTPPNVTLNVQSSQSFYVLGKTASTSYTFVPAGSVTWSVLGSIGTVDPSSGLFTASNAGTGSVRATDTTQGFNSGATITVNSVQVTTGKWTIMVFMNAANDLSVYSPQNIEQMQQIATNSNVRILVQWKQVSSLPYPAQFNGTRRYLITHSTGSSVSSQLIQDMGTGVDMGSATTLNDFINWCKTYYPANHYALVVWDHGNGWHRAPAASTRAVSYDDEFGSSIQVWQLSQAIGNNHLDILAWDASLMQMAEVADEISSQVDYVVGSEESPPGAGYPYNLAFAPFENNPDDTARNLSKGFVDAMVNGYAGSQEHITQSVIDSTQLPALMTAIKGLGTALTNNVSTIATGVQTARNTAQTYSQTASRYYRDLYDLTLKLDANITVPDVQSADAAVRSAITNAVVWEGHNSLSPGSHGIAIDFTPGSSFVSYVSDYDQMRFEADTLWGNWLQIAP